jgi:hypothetical protein
MVTMIVLGVLIALFVLETVLTEVEHFGWATAALIVTVAVAQIFHLVDLFSFVKENTAAFLGYVGLYVVCAVPWSFVKWFSFLRNYRDQYREYKGKFLASRNIPVTASVPDVSMSAFKDFVSNNYTWTRGDVNLAGLSNLQRPRARDNKSRIVSWMAFWPFSLVGTLLNDPVRRFFSWVFTTFSSLYQRMADYVFRNDLELK